MSDESFDRKAFDDTCRRFNAIVLELYEQAKLQQLAPQRMEELIVEAADIIRMATKEPNSEGTDKMVKQISDELRAKILYTQGGNFKLH